MAMKGSLEGYISTKPAHVQINGTGYNNPAHQRARYSTRNSLSSKRNYDIMKGGSSNTPASTYSDGRFVGPSYSSSSRLNK